MNEKNDRSLKQYFKENLVVLLFELVIVLLLSCICTLMLGGKPAWLPPVLAVFAYLMAEMRFLMAYLAGCSHKEPEASSEDMEDEDDLGMPQDFAEQEAQDEEEAVFIPPVLKSSEEPLEETAEEITETTAWMAEDEWPDEPIVVPENIASDDETQPMEVTDTEDLLFEEPGDEDEEDFEPRPSYSEEPESDDLPTQSVLDLGDDEDPFSH